jgi:hypothetical protein
MTLGRHFWLAPALLALAGCPEPVVVKPPPPPAPEAHGPFDLDPKSAPLEAGALERVRARPLGYFRLINAAFANEVCRRFGEDLDAMRAVNLHGDAHLEQYAITDTGRGLTDFDDAASGPAFLDLARFSTSLALACQERGWEASTDAIIARFLDGYRAALGDPTKVAPEPRIVARIRGGLHYDPQAYFSWLASIAQPVTPDVRAQVALSLEPYVAGVVEAHTGIGADYFAIEDVGTARIGIGSSGKSKYVVRVVGATPSPDDDDVLELKELSDVSNIGCLSRTAAFDPMRLIVAQARIAYEPYRFVGYVSLGGKYYWVHAWAKSYKELMPADVADVDELGEVAFDVGVQLGLGHPRYIAAPFDAELRKTAIAFLDAKGPAIVSFAKSSAAEVTAAWQRYRDATDE